MNSISCRSVSSGNYLYIQARAKFDRISWYRWYPLDPRLIVCQTTRTNLTFRLGNHNLCITDGKYHSSRDRNDQGHYVIMFLLYRISTSAAIFGMANIHLQCKGRLSIGNIFRIKIIFFCWISIIGNKFAKKKLTIRLQFHLAEIWPIFRVLSWTHLCLLPYVFDHKIAHSPTGTYPFIWQKVWISQSYFSRNAVLYWSSFFIQFCLLYCFT